MLTCDFGFSVSIGEKPKSRVELKLVCDEYSSLSQSYRLILVVLDSYLALYGIMASLGFMGVIIYLCNLYLYINPL